MNRLFRVIRRKRNVRRLLAGAFLIIALVEIGSHAFMDNRDVAALQDLMVCRLSQEHSPSADCPDNKRQRGPESNLMDEMTSHCVLLNDLTVPLRGSLYNIALISSRTIHPISRSLDTPFHPPKQA